VTVETTEGQRLETHVTAARGTTARPMSDAELDAKFRELAAYGAPTVDADALLAALKMLGEKGDVSDVVKVTGSS
jgi:2-methylcitrate dehydratase PrpD